MAPTMLVSRSDRDDIDEPPETLEVFRVSGIDRESCGTGCCRNEEIQCASAPCLASAGHFCSVDPSVSAGRLSVEGKRIECRFCSLQPVLSTSPLVGVDRRVRPGGKLCHGDRADGQLDGELIGLELLEVYDD